MSLQLSAGDPVMFIRCFSNLEQEATIFSKAPCEEGRDGYFSYEGQCYPLPDDSGACSKYLMPGVVTLEDKTEVTICIPDCSMSESCNEKCSDVHWNPVKQGCYCEEFDTIEEPENVISDGFFCDCPEPLEIRNGMTGITLANGKIVDGTGDCSLPFKNCYDLGISWTVSPIICDRPMVEDEVITIVIKQADGSAFSPNEDALTLEDLQNCELLDGSGGLIDLVGQYGTADRAAFVANSTGCIEIEFTRDPTQETTISFLSNDPIVIPACPRAFDPCSCRPENIYDAEGIVEFWYDELHFVGNPNTTVVVGDSNEPGFLDDSLTPYAGEIGTTDADGILNIPFYRTPGEVTEVTLIDANDGTTTLTSECTLAVDACVEIEIVPTMGQWGIMSLSILMMIFSLVALRQNKLAPVKVKN